MVTPGDHGFPADYLYLYLVASPFPAHKFGVKGTEQLLSELDLPSAFTDCLGLHISFLLCPLLSLFRLMNACLIASSRESASCCASSGVSVQIGVMGGNATTGVFQPAHLEPVLSRTQT
jgi:hypothetical protein